MAVPGTATDYIFPDWRNAIDNWREQDAEWLRNRSVNIFPDASTRTSVMGTPPMVGLMSFLQSGSVAGGPDFWDGSGWQSVRYPNLGFTSDGTSFTLRRQGAGTGVQLMSDGSVNMAKAFMGTGGIGATIDNTGILLKIGADTAKLTTDANGFAMDSPLNITGGLQTSALATLNSLTVTGATTLSGTTAAQAVTAASVAATGAVTGATVTGGKVLLGVAAPYGTIKHADGGTAEFDVGSDSTVQIKGTTLTVSPTTVNISGTVNLNGTTNLVGAANLAPAGKTAVQVAGILMVSGNVAPSQNAPDGTIYFTY